MLQRLRARLEVIVLNRGWSGLSVYDQRGELLVVIGDGGGQCCRRSSGGTCCSAPS